MRTVTPGLAFGITAAARPGAAELGAALEALAYEELWSNDTPRGDGIATLAATAAHAPRLRLAVGVVALSEQDPATIAERVGSAGLPAGRFTLGVGSGSSRSLDLVRRGVADLRRLLPGLPIAVAAVGSRMAELAGEVGDALVANWALPSQLSALRGQAVEGAASAGRQPPRLVAYVRVSIGPEAASRMRAEMDRYARRAPHYARAFAAQGGVPVGVAVESGDRAEVARGLAPYRSVVDTLVVRGLPAGDQVEDWLEIARAASEAGS